ncbi:MAG: hypothetical protein AAF493_28755, partial [Pseudomonadota bacterium]
VDDTSDPGNELRAHAVAALLNAYTARNNAMQPSMNWFGLDPDQVIHMFNQNAAGWPEELLETFKAMNDRMCPLG